MSKLHEFLDGNRPDNKPEGMPFYGSVNCQTCGEAVDEQTLYPADGVLVWQCSQNHKSFMENFRIF